MFYKAPSFDQPLADWNVSSVADMRGMFAGASSFNQSLADWNASSETDLTAIFFNSGCPGSEGEEGTFKPPTRPVKGTISIKSNVVRSSVSPFVAPSSSSASPPPSPSCFYII
jgi:hypothetical protein